jgi:aspartyl-tRNA(Asn)/glutamyl-tRNA(Gln) amidotransferase subunit A
VTEERDQLTIHEAHRLLTEKAFSSAELTEACLGRIRHLDPLIGATVTVTEELAREQARRADAAIAAGDAGPLTGIPALVKDNMCTRGVPTTCSSRMLKNFVPPYDATVVEKLSEAGAVVLGKANMDEFAMGSSTEHSAVHPTRNPWDLSRVPGGSSGGSAAAVAAGEALFALGSDTGGSIRQPAGFCGVTGLKPTYGRVSRYGLVAFASSLDQIGPLAQDAFDCALVMNAIAGHDSRDSTSAPVPVPDFTAGLTGDIRGMKIGIPREYFVDGMEPEVEAAVRAAIGELERLGAGIDWDVSLPSTPHALAVYYIIAPSEASANLARYDGVKYGFADTEAGSMWEEMEATREQGFGAEVKRRIMLGTYALSAGYYDAYYLKAQKVRTLIRREFDEAFEKYDVLVTPTSPTVPFKMGEKLDDPVQMYMADVCTLPINIAGLPAISVPAGLSGGLPVGLQVIGKPFAEETVLSVAHAFQQVTDWHHKKPRVV